MQGQLDLSFGHIQLEPHLSNEVQFFFSEPASQEKAIGIYKMII